MKNKSGGCTETMIRFTRSSDTKQSIFLHKLGRIAFGAVCLCLLLCCATDLIPQASAASELKASNSCVDFIKSNEGFSSTPYYDYGQYTVGYGTKCPDDKYDQYKAHGISKQDAEALLRNELTEIEETLNQKFIDKYNLTVPQQQFDALVSFSYNVGTGWISYDSSLRNAILSNASDADLTYAFSLYCTAGGKYLPGLVKRRLCEANIYMNGIYSKNLSNDFGYVYYDTNGGTLEYRVQGYLCAGNPVPAADATRSGSTFLGWYTELNGGTKVDVLTGAMTGKTLFARWQSSDTTADQNATSTTVKVTGDGVNIRSGPGTAYGIVKQVYRNTSVTVTHITHLTDMRWGKIQDGWICLDFTNYDEVISGSSSTAPEPPSNGGSASDNSIWSDFWGDSNNTNNQTAVTGTVNVNDYLIIRSGAGTNYNAVGFLFKGDQVEILEQRTVGSREWGRISKGWVCMDYIVTGNNSSNSGTNQKPESGNTNSSGQAESVSIKGKITADALRIRSAAGTDKTIVGFYYRNDTVTITEKVLVGSVYWGKTNRGWISIDYVQEETSNDNTMDTSGLGKKTIKADCLRIRQNPGTDQKIVGLLYNGNTVTITEIKTVGGTSWGRIDKGWISMDYVK